MNNTSTQGRRPKIAQLLACVVIAATAAGCSSEGSNDYSKMLDLAKMYWTGDDRHVTLEEAAAVPYATIGVQIGDGSQSLLLLATQIGDQMLWTSDSHVVIVTDHGRIVMTAGLPANLGNLTSSSGPPMSPAALLAAPRVEHFVADFPDIGAMSTPVACATRVIGPRTVTILGKPLPSALVEEHCNAQTLSWSFTNRYWVASDGSVVWRSEQYTHPKSDPVIIETLRPPE